MLATIATLILGVFAAISTPAAAGELSAKETKRVQEAATVLKEIHAVPDKDVPQELWERAECVIVVPGRSSSAASTATD